MLASGFFPWSIGEEGAKSHTVLGGGGQDDGEVEDLGQRGVGEHGVAVEGGVEVAGKVEEALLHVDDEQHGVVLVQSLPGDGFAVRLAGLPVVRDGGELTISAGNSGEERRDGESHGELHFDGEFSEDGPAES